MWATIYTEVKFDTFGPVRGLGMDPSFQNLVKIAVLWRFSPTVFSGMLNPALSIYLARSGNSTYRSR